MSQRTKNLQRPGRSGLCPGIVVALASLGAGCAAVNTPSQPLPAAAAGTLAQCAALGPTFSFQNTRLQSVALVNDPKQLFAGAVLGEYCLIRGKMNERVSPVDGQTYAIGFEMRLPQAWNGRFLYQGNGGTDGVVAPAERYAIA